MDISFRFIVEYFTDWPADIIEFVKEFASETSSDPNFFEEFESQFESKIESWEVKENDVWPEYPDFDSSDEWTTDSSSDEDGSSEDDDLPELENLAIVR